MKEEWSFQKSIFGSKLPTVLENQHKDPIYKTQVKILIENYSLKEGNLTLIRRERTCKKINFFSLFIYTVGENIIIKKTILLLTKIN
jgi:hypothetical protein